MGDGDSGSDDSTRSGTKTTTDGGDMPSINEPHVLDGVQIVPLHRWEGDAVDSQEIQSNSEYKR